MNSIRKLYYRHIFYPLRLRYYAIRRSLSVSRRFEDPKFIDNVCMSYRHDFSLLSEEEMDRLRFDCKEWMRSIENNEFY